MNIKAAILSIVAFFLLSITHAQNTKFAVASIPQDLLPQANAIIRNQKITIDVTGKNVIEQHQFAITILNEKANYLAILRAFYNSFSSVSKINGNLYDKDGKKLQSLRKDRIADVSTFGSSYTFHDDLRVKLYDFDHKQYPYTVEFEYEIKTNNNFFLPYWMPQLSEHVAVEQSEFILGHVKGAIINRKAYNMPENVETGVYYESINEFERWKVKAIKATTIQPQDGAVSSLPMMAFVPQNVTFAKFEGDASSWNTLGLFLYNINKDRDNLPEAVKTKAQSLTANAKTDQEKISILYKFLQDNTRYVANEYGLAGWQTFEAAEVAKLNYGDCKGLSNYMKALLKAVEIPSHLVVINAGAENVQKTDVDFVRNQFNHMILCVPQEQDTIWLECTSTTNAPGYLGSFTQNRKALILTAEGGDLVNTPQYNKKSSQLDRTIEIWLHPDQDKSTVQWKTKYLGLLQDDLSSLLKSGSNQNIKKHIQKAVPYKEYDILSQKYEQLQEIGKVPMVTESIEMNVGHLIEPMSKRLLVNIPINQSVMADLSSNTKRTQPFELNKDVQYILNYKIHIPEGYEIEMAPKNYTIEKPFAKLSSSVNEAAKMLVIEYHFEQNAGTYNASVFDEYVKMRNSVNQHLSTIQLSMVKK